MIRPPFERSQSLDGLPGVQHGFFGRRSGQAGNNSDLNVSGVLGDDPAAVGSNRWLAMTAIGAGALPLASLGQIHSARVITLNKIPQPDDRPQADGMVTALPGLALGIVTADCAPILFADAAAGVIGACHAGWQGALDGIIGNTLSAMSALGARPDRIAASIGPTISFANYEVGDAFADAAIERNPAARPFLRIPADRQTIHFDLPGFIEAELAGRGVATIDSLHSCTYASPLRYFSHRHHTHHGGQPGRQISLIVRIGQPFTLPQMAS